MTGSGFLPSDTTCTFSSPSSYVVSSSACVIANGALSGGFTVGNVVTGAYLVEASGNQGDFAQAVLDVNGGAQLFLSPASGPPGASVSIHGSGFLPSDNTCTISSPSSPNVVLTGACAIKGGTGYTFGGFTIGAVPLGEYVVEVTGSQGDTAQAIIDVV